MQYPPQVEKLIASVESLPAVVACFCSPKPLEDLKPNVLSLPGEFGDLPQAILRRTNGGRQGEVMIQIEVILDRSPDAWLSLEFLAWWVRDWARIDEDIQMRPMALPPKAGAIQLGRTLKFLIEYFLIETSDDYSDTLSIVDRMAESIDFNFRDYTDCFANPAEFTGDVESI